MESCKAILGLLAGIAAGTLLGILIAPEKGSKTRTKFLKKGENYIDEIKDQFDTLFDTLTEKFDRTKADVENIAAKGSKKYAVVK